MDTLKASVDTSTASKAMIVMLIGALALAGASRFLTAQKDPQEPPFLQSGIPLVGHLIHLFRKGAKYYTELYSQYHQGLYTLPIFKARMYMVSSPEWATAIHKAHKTLSFHTLVARAMKMAFGMDDSTMKIINENLNDEKGDRSGILWETHDMMFKTLAPGKVLDDLNKSFLDELAPHLNALARDGKVERIELYGWLRHRFSLASAAAIYGPKNPMALDPRLVSDFFEFADNIFALFTTPFPSIFARKTYMAQQRLFNGMIEYVDKGRYKDGSTLAKQRAGRNLDAGLSTEMYGKSEVSMMFALLVNTVPSWFWLLSYIFADPQLLADVRAEVDQCLRAGEGNRRIINATKLKTQCPLFFSTLRESLRMRACMNITRYVLEDTLATNHVTGETYKLKKGSFLQVAANVIHFQPGVFGEDVDTFNPRRFMPSAENSSDLATPFRDAQGKVHGGAFRTFGGGKFGSFISQLWLV